MDFDVCIPTFNSEKTLERCLKSIIRVIPYRKIIIADSFSTDKTKKIAKKYGCEFHYCKGKLGEARNLLIRLAKTEWFFFIDSDIVVNKEWFKKLYEELQFISKNNLNVGALNGFGLPDDVLLNNFRKLFLLTKIRLGINQRAFTSNTLVRKKAVAGIRLPNIKRTEDIILQKEIGKRGWEWKFVPAFCLHLKTSKQLLMEAKRDFFTIAKREGYFRALTKL